jgi:O-antigen/teichoic acid export membrane protein
MHKKFLENLAFLIFLNLLVKPFWILGIDREVQNTVGPEEYGFYFAVFNFSFLFFIFLDLGITNFNNRNIAQNNQLLSKHLAGISTLKLMLGVLYAVVIFLIGVLIGYEGRQLYLLAWVGFNQFLLSFILYLRSNVSGLLLFKTDSLLSVMDRLLMILICSLLLWTNVFGGYFSIEWFVYAQTIAYSLTAIVALIAVLHKSGKLQLNWNVPFFILIVKKSMPFALLVLLMSFYNRIDPVLIERLLPESVGEQQSGVYAQAYRLLDAGQNFAFLFAVLLLPLFSKMIKDRMPVDYLVKLSFSILISGALIVAVTSAFYGKELMLLMYTPFEGEPVSDYISRINESAFIFSLLMFSFVAISSNYIFGTLLTANNNLKQLNWIALIGLSLNFLLNFLLIPRYQAIGSAYASLTAQGTTAILQFYFAFKLLRLKPDYKLLGSILITVGLMIITGYTLRTFPPQNWIISVSILIGIGIIVAFIFRLLNVKAFLLILKSKD